MKKVKFTELELELLQDFSKSKASEAWEKLLRVQAFNIRATAIGAQSMEELRFLAGQAHHIQWEIEQIRKFNKTKGKINEEKIYGKAQKNDEVYDGEIAEEERKEEMVISTKTTPNLLEKGLRILKGKKKKKKKK